MANSLLAHLYSHIRGSQEDIATLSLQYIISQSSELNAAFTNLLGNSLNISIDESISYSCQQTGRNKERPDMVGCDNTGNEIVICEMKFYAGLTDNQPLTYLECLKGNNGKGLVFVCPSVRKNTLWHKLISLCKEQPCEEIGEWCISVNGINMSIITWPEVIELLYRTASSVAVHCLSDIQQLDGYCKQMDSDAFIPFESSDLTAEVAKKAERYYRVIDEVINLLEAEKNINTSLKGVRATPYRNGYARYIHIDEFAVSINYDRNMWKNPSSIETPFWVSFKDSNWKITDEMIKKFSTIPDIRKDNLLWGAVWIALEPLKNATLQEVATDLKEQILNYMQIFK